MINIVCLIIGTILTILYLFMTIKGKEYESLLENVDEKEFMGKELFGVGLAWEYTFPLLSYAGIFGKKIRPDVNIYYGDKYCEYYCSIILAQVYTYIHICICFFSLLAGFAGGKAGLLLIIIGVIMGGALGGNYLNQVSEKIKKRADECIQEFPNMVTKLALLLNSGMILREAWYTVKDNTEGQLHELMQMSCELMENGYADADALYRFGVNSGSKEMKKFVGALIQGLEKGNAELSGILVQQSAELWEIKRQHLLQKGAEAETKLVIPTTLMFVGLIIVVVSSALTGMSI